MARRNNDIFRKAAILNIADRRSRNDNDYEAEMRRRRDRYGRFTSEMDTRTPWDYPMTDTYYSRVGFDYPTARSHHEQTYHPASRYYESEPDDMNYRSVDKEKAEKCVRSLVHSNGSMGELFSFDEIKTLVNRKGLFEDVPLVYMFMNKAKSAFQPMAKELNMDNPDFYLKMALAKIKHLKENHKHQ